MRARLTSILCACLLVMVLSVPGQSLVVGNAPGVPASAARTEPLIIDHTCTDLSQIPPHWIEQAKAQLRVSYGHTSHGSQLVTGLDVLESGPLNIDGLYDFNTSGAIQVGVLSLADYTPDGDLGNPDYTTWAARTRTYLDNAGSDRNVVVWSWCGQADTTVQNINVYLGLMDALEQDYPDVTFVHMTGHLNGSGEAGNLHQRNEQIRAYCRANNKVLFDFADIESYNPDGDYFLDLGATDTCDYSGGNWASEWCAAHPGDPLCATCSCAHSQPLNCNLKGRAFWWMLARLSGWSGPGETVKAASVDTATIGTVVTYTVTVQNLTAPLTATVYVTDTLPAGLTYLAGSLEVTGGTGAYDDTHAPALTWVGTLSPTTLITMTYSATVTALHPTVIVNTATVAAPDYQTLTVSATVIVNPMRLWLPLILRSYP